MIVCRICGKTANCEIAEEMDKWPAGWARLEEAGNAGTLAAVCVDCMASWSHILFLTDQMAELRDKLNSVYETAGRLSLERDILATEVVRLKGKPQ